LGVREALIFGPSAGDYTGERKEDAGERKGERRGTSVAPVGGGARGSGGGGGGGGGSGAGVPAGDGGAARRAELSKARLSAAKRT